jgi:AbrB family looped-hinge helix DNA binding protein
MERYVSSVSTKGQVTLPMQLRKLTGIKPGDKVVIAIEHDEIVVRKSPSTWRDSYRSVPALDRTVDLEEMTEIAAAGHAREAAREGLETE